MPVERTYKKRVEASHVNWSPNQIASAKNGRSKARRIAKKLDLLKEIAKKVEILSKMSPQSKLKMLDDRLGKGVGAEKERGKLMAIINKSSEDKQQKKGDKN